MNKIIDYRGHARASGSCTCAAERCLRHRSYSLDAHRHGTCLVYDDSRAVTLLRRPGPREECFVCVDAVFAITGLMSLLWFVAGYSIAFGTDGVEPGAYMGDMGNFSSLTFPWTLCAMVFPRRCL